MRSLENIVVSASTDSWYTQRHATHTTRNAFSLKRSWEAKKNPEHIFMSITIHKTGMLPEVVTASGEHSRQTRRTKQKTPSTSWAPQGHRWGMCTDSLCPRAGKAGAEKGSQDTIGNFTFISCSKNKQGVNDFWRFYFARGKTERGINFQI